MDRVNTPSTGRTRLPGLIRARSAFVFGHGRDYRFEPSQMPVLSDPGLRMIAEVVTEMAKHRGRSFDASAFAVTLGRAALADRASRRDSRRSIGGSRRVAKPIFPTDC